MEQDIQQASATRLENIFQQLAKLKANGCLQLSYNSIIFFVYFNEGKLIYATNSLAPFERLERHLRRLSNRNSNLTNKVIKEARQKFRNVLESYTENPSDYRGLMWLTSEQKYLSKDEAITILRRVTREVFESILSLPEPLNYSFVEQSRKLVELCSFDLDSYLKQCQKRLQAWQTFSNHIQSSYQRLYLANSNDSTIRNLTTEQNETICKLLKGLNFRQISALIDQDELIVAKILHSSIINNTVLVRSRKPPFDKLPILPKTQNLFEDIIVEDLFNDVDIDSDVENSSTRTTKKFNSNSKETIYALEKQWKLACVDDNLNIHRQLEDFLDRKIFTISFIREPMNAFAKLIEFKPELILLDAEMPNINGYELCGLLRSHYDFKYTPIIMLSGEQGILNMTKSRLAGATDHLIKPFTQSSLLSIVFKYLQ